MAAQSEIKEYIPGVGDRVFYESYGTPGGEYSRTFRAAIITEVDRPGDPNSPVGLAVLNPTGLFFNQHVEHLKSPGGWWNMTGIPARE